MACFYFFVSALEQWLYFLLISNFTLRFANFGVK